MTLTQLKYVIETAKVGSINRAATNLFVSQSVLSTSIKKLETEIKHTIFNRSNRGISLTPFGITFISYISSIQAQLLQLEYFVSHGMSKQEFFLSIVSAGYYFLDQICTNIYKKYKTMSVRIEEYETSINNIADMVSGSTAEIGITHLWTCYKSGYLSQLRAKGLKYYPITNLDVAITIGPRNPLFNTERDTISAMELKDYPTVKYFYMDYGPYSDIYNRLHLPNAKNCFIISSRSSLYEILRNSNAYYLNSIYPIDKKLKYFTPYYNLRTLRLKDCSIRSEIAWIKLKDHSLSLLADEVISRITSYFSFIT